jgi:sodium-dependent dicarboxylate transporter 2/3/5
MDSIQIILFFFVSYLLSRVFVVLKIPELIVYYLLEKKHVSVQRLTLILILGSALISTIIANVITVLTLMPLVLLLQSEVTNKNRETLKINTLFLLSMVWGANIGGIGMVTGTTTNGVLIGLYEVYKMDISPAFTFVSWMTWGMPLAILLSIIGWAILMLIFKPGNLSHTLDFDAKLDSAFLSRKLQKVGFILAASFIITASILSYLLSVLDGYKLYVLGATLIWTLLYLYYMLFHKYNTEGGKNSSLLQFKDTMQDLPKKGILWIGIGLVLTLVLWKLNFHKSMAIWLSDWMQGKHSLFWIYLSLALITTFASEIISNSAVQITSFMVLFPMVRYNPEFSWQGMLIIALCSTCAFMTPLATPANGLGFGASSKVSLKHMLLAGLLMDVACAVIISLWVFFLVPLVLTLYL